jgi:hypothetical protein|tara:strand:+ start:564 stop:1913 length:1350 start_codon:yes stop_codon:yes gene_type:complete
MRSKDYNDQVKSFTPLEPHQMVRVALAEGTKPQYPEPERQRYRRLLKDCTIIDESRIDVLFRIMQRGSSSPREKKFLDALVAEVDYDSSAWKPLDYNALKKEGVIIEHDGNLKGLTGLVQEIDESKVIFVPSVGERAAAPEDEQDYKKHVDSRNKLVLNGKDVVARFAQDRGFELPENYLKRGYMTTEVLTLLERHGFYFTEALRTAVEVLKEPKYENRVITTMAIKRRDGTELRLHPHDFVEAAEFYTYCLLHNKAVVETLGDKLTELGDKYHGASTFDVPKRTPIGRNRHNNVELHYFPNPKRDGPYPLDWMNTKVTCDCPHALNMRNYEERNGRMTRVVETMDTHADMVFLAMMHKKGISPGEAVNNMSPIPTLEFSRIVDRTRYNIVQEFEVDVEGRTRTRRAYVREDGIEKILNELAKSPEWTFERMFNGRERVGRKLLRPMLV